MLTLVLVALGAAPGALAANAKKPPGAKGAQPPATAPTTDDTGAPTAVAQPTPDGHALLRAYVAACGGLEALRGISNAIVTARYSVAAQGLSGSVRIAFARPDRILSVAAIEGVGTVSQGYDGTTGWESNPMTGPRLLSDLELEQLRASESNVFNLESIDKLYPTAEVAGRAEFKGAPAWKVRLVTAAGRESIAYFDMASGLMTGMEASVASALGNIPAVITLGDYKPFGRIKLPVNSTQSLMGGLVEAVSTIESVEFDVPAGKLPSFAPPPDVAALMGAAGE